MLATCLYDVFHFANNRVKQEDLNFYFWQFLRDQYPACIKALN